MFSFAIFIGLLALSWITAWCYLRIMARAPGAVVDAGVGNRLAALEGLRGVLALSVFVHHACCTRNLFLGKRYNAETDELFAQTGIYAVTLFFFITGFLFWSKLQRDPFPNVARHLRSRLTRLGPAYWASLAMVGLFVVVQRAPGATEPSFSSVRAIANWVLFTVPGLGDQQNWPNISRIFAGITWTLRLEWIFYLIIPFCGWFAARSWRVGLFSRCSRRFTS